VLWAGNLTVLVAESGGSKTFVQLDMGAAISADMDWHGRRVRHGSVVYIGFEGHVGLRLRALREVAGHYLQHVYLIRGSEPLSPIVDRDRVERPSRGELEIGDALEQLAAHLQASELPPIVLVQIDTVRASLAGSEDNSEAVSGYLRAVRRLQARAVPEAAVMLAHHAGWMDGETKRKRERGSSAFRGNVDATMYLEAEDYDQEHGTARLTMRALKVRDGELPAPLHLIRRRVEIPSLVDRWGEPVTSCVIDSDRRSREDREAEQVSATEAAQRAVDLKVLQAMHDYPTATSIRVLRAQVALGEAIVTAAVGRIVRAGWAAPGRRQEPYQVLPAGYQVLGIANDTNDTERHRTTPECRSEIRHPTPPLRGVGARANSGALELEDTTPEDIASGEDGCR
jgi:hypothetical protein